MNAHESGICAICRQPAIQRRVDDDVSAYDIDCDACGKYRVGGTYNAELRSRANQRRNPWLKFIANANAAGFRLSIPDGSSIPLVP